MNFRKSIIYALILWLILILPISMLMPRAAKANVNSSLDLISLGDSIAYGLNAPSGQGYFDLFYTYLQKKSEQEGVRAYNLSEPGDRSRDLLHKLENFEYIQGFLGNARTVTVSIGGNNILEPVIQSVAAAYHLDPSDPQLNTKLGKALQTDENQFNTFYGLVLSGTLKAGLDEGVANFKTDWPRIVELIKTQAPKSQIYVLTVYNPFPQDDFLFSIFDPYVQEINTKIKDGEGYSTADIYSCFKQGSGQKPLDYNLLEGRADPHPTKQGHTMIFQTLSALFDLANASSWESKDGVIVGDKTWTIKFSMPLADFAAKFVRVYTSTGLQVNVSVEHGGLWTQSLIVLPPHDNYAPGLYSLFIMNGLPSKSGQQLDGSVKLDFKVE